MINVGLSCCLCLFDNLNWMQGFDVTGNSLTWLLSLTQTGFEVKFLDQPLTKSSLEKILNPIKLDKMWFIWAEDIFRWLCQKYAKREVEYRICSKACYSYSYNQSNAGSVWIRCQNGSSLNKSQSAPLKIRMCKSFTGKDVWERFPTSSMTEWIELFPIPWPRFVHCKLSLDMYLVINMQCICMIIHV